MFLCKKITLIITKYSLLSRAQIPVAFSQAKGSGSTISTTYKGNIMDPVPLACIDGLEDETF